MKWGIRAALFVAASAATVLVAPTAASADITIQATCYTTVNVASSDYGMADPIAMPSTGSTASSTNCGMAQGATSNAVKALQRALNCYGAGLTVDGIFGSNTRSALISAQNAENITADGIYGTQTRDNIKWRTIGGRCQYAAIPVRTY